MEIVCMFVYLLYTHMFNAFIWIWWWNDFKRISQGKCWEEGGVRSGLCSWRSNKSLIDNLRIQHIPPPTAHLHQTWAALILVIVIWGSCADTQGLFASIRDSAFHASSWCSCVSSIIKIFRQYSDHADVWLD